MVKDFNRITQSLQRQLNEESNCENVPSIPEGTSTLVVSKPVKELLVDSVSVE